MPSQLPQGWEARSLAATAALCATGYWGEDQGGPDLLPARVIRNGDVGEGRIKPALPTRFFTAKQIERARVAPGDAILVSSGNVGRIARVGESDATPVTVASNFVRLVRAGPSTTGDFLGHLLASSLVQQQLATHIAGSAIKNLHGSAYDEVMLPLPPLAEQRKIAAILSSVDETIEKTEAVIAQLDVVKKAMLAELLTRGIPGRHSRFKQTEIGEVPEEWEVAKLGELVDVLSGFPFKSELFTEDATRGTPLIRIRDLRRDKTTARFLGSFDPRYLMEPGEILVGMDGDFDVCRWRGAPALLNQRVCRVTPREGRGLVSSFLGYLLVPLLLRINASTSATTVKHLSVRDISSSAIALPGIREQELIGDALTALDNRRLQEQAVLGFLTRTKQSLAGELLSGNLRVGVTRGDE